MTPELNVHLTRKSDGNRFSRAYIALAVIIMMRIINECQLKSLGFFYGFQGVG